MTDLRSLWETHKEADWPRCDSPQEGALMTLDTVISGCVVYCVEHRADLDLQRIEMLRACLADLDAILPEVTDDSREYFERLRALGGILVDAPPYG